MNIHTEGKWLLGHGVIRIDVFEESGKMIASVPRDDTYGRPYAETKANALLIASAPEMLNALRRAVLALAFAAESSDAMRDDYNAVSEAIRKATGAT